LRFAPLVAALFRTVGRLTPGRPFLKKTTDRRMHEGTIVSVLVDKGYGFIFEQTGADDVFFHKSALVNLEFNAQLHERRVTFDIEDSPKGPRAANVQAVD
jgi:cold shock protein